jgi:hypothetical protein
VGGGAPPTTAQIPTVDPNPDWSFGYGYQLWLGREGYRLDGAYGQFALVLPERGLVVAITSAQSCTQLLLDQVWGVLLPELEACAVGSPREAVEIPAADDQGIATPADSGLGSTWAVAGPVELDEALVESPDPQSNLPALADLWARRDGAGIKVGFTTNGAAVEVSAGVGRWVRQPVAFGDLTIPVAVAAGANPFGDLDVRLLFTDSPHTLRLRLSAGSAGQAWGTVPLQGGNLAGLLAR